MLQYVRGRGELEGRDVIEAASVVMGRRGGHG